MQKETSDSHYNVYVKLTQLRSNSEILKHGNLKTEVLNNEQILVVVREQNNEQVILLINFSNDKSQNVDVSSLTNGEVDATVYVSSVGSQMAWK